MPPSEAIIGTVSKQPSRSAPDDRHALGTMRERALRLPPARYDEADEIETECPMCTLELDGGEWVHERSRLRARHRTA